MKKSKKEKTAFIESFVVFLFFLSYKYSMASEANQTSRIVVAKEKKTNEETIITFFALEIANIPWPDVTSFSEEMAHTHRSYKKRANSISFS